MTVSTPVNVSPADGAINVALNPTLVGSEFESDIVTKAYLTGIYDWITTSFNTGDMRVPDGAWANDTDPTDSSTTIPDHSIAGNDLTVVGTVSKLGFSCSPAEFFYLRNEAGEIITTELGEIISIDAGGEGA